MVEDVAALGYQSVDAAEANHQLYIYYIDFLLFL
jgi:hypothetical protein